MKKLKLSLTIIAAMFAIILSVNNTSVANAGPCANRGCIGDQGSCGVSYVMIEIGDFQIIRNCNGSKAAQIIPA